MWARYKLPWQCHVFFIPMLVNVFFSVSTTLVTTNPTVVDAFMTTPRPWGFHQKPQKIIESYTRHAVRYSAPPSQEESTISTINNTLAHVQHDNNGNTINSHLVTSPLRKTKEDILQKLLQKQSSTPFHRSSSSSALQGLSKFHLSLIRQRRQRFVAGDYPVIVTLRNNPTRRWLNTHNISATELHVNGTTPERSAASLDRLGWMEPGDRMLTLELLAELCDIPCPGYVNVLQEDHLWITGFSMTDRGHVLSVDCRTGAITRYDNAMLRWPNEVHAVPGEETSVLVCDGFLVPTKDKGGLYVLQSLRDNNHTMTRLTKETDRWFYHRAAWVDMTGDGRLSILTARCRLSALEQGAGIVKTGQLVWLEAPLSPNEPWVTHVLATGPDVMFAVTDMDPHDDCIELVASEFFSKRVVLYSIQRGPRPQVVFQRVIDDQCGQAYACILANLDPERSQQQQVIDSGSTVECLAAGDSFSHVLVTSHECGSAARPVDTAANLSREGGSLFAYQVPTGTRDAWKTEPWKRTTIASGFKVNGKLNNMINPGAPGFVYTFALKRGDKLLKKRPFIAVAGDCAESAYIFQPDGGKKEDGTCYTLLAEIQCESTVGSLAVSYDNFGDNNGYARLFIPCYEKDRVLVFGFGDLE